MAKETAEQKLLKALQKKTASPDISTTKNPNSSKGFNFSFSILDLNKFLFLGIVISIVVLVLQLRSGMALLNKKMDYSDEIKTNSYQRDARLPEAKALKIYTDSFGNRNIFRPYDINLGKATQAQPNLAKRFSKYKLVGVAWLDLPESASIMIEDMQSKTTYILKTGEKLEGVTIKTIYTDRVVFSYENEETTIKL